MGNILGRYWVFVAGSQL